MKSGHGKLKVVPQVGPLTLVEKIMVIDKQVSGKIQVLVAPVAVEYFLYFMASIFNRKKALWALFFLPALACLCHHRICLIIANPNNGAFDHIFSEDLS